MILMVCDCSRDLCCVEPPLRPRLLAPISPACRVPFALGHRCSTPHHDGLIVSKVSILLAGEYC